MHPARLARRDGRGGAPVRSVVSARSDTCPEGFDSSEVAGRFLAGLHILVAGAARSGGTTVMDEWTLSYAGYDPQDEGLREALCTLGNGVLATRRAAPECRADGVHYPGSYRAGVFNRLVDEVDGVEVANESMVNVPKRADGRDRRSLPDLRGGCRGGAGRAVGVQASGAGLLYISEPAGRSSRGVRCAARARWRRCPTGGWPGARARGSRRRAGQRRCRWRRRAAPTGHHRPQPRCGRGGHALPVTHTIAPRVDAVRRGPHEARRSAGGRPCPAKPRSPPPTRR